MCLFYLNYSDNITSPNTSSHIDYIQFLYTNYTSIKLVYIVNFKTVRATQWDTVLEKKQKQKNYIE